MKKIEPRVEFEDRVMRYPGLGTFSLHTSSSAIAVIDGAGGRTVGRASLDADGFIAFEGDRARVRMIVEDWMAWCRANDRDPWTTK